MKPISATVSPSSIPYLACDLFALGMMNTRDFYSALPSVQPSNYFRQSYSSIVCFPKVGQNLLTKA